MGFDYFGIEGHLIGEIFGEDIYQKYLQSISDRLIILINCCFNYNLTDVKFGNYLKLQT